MKDLGLYTGAAISSWLSKTGLGSLTKFFSKFEWWEVVLISIYALILVVIGGVIGMAIQELIEKIFFKKNQWNGKKKGWTLYT